MATNHVAIMRSAARMAQQKAADFQQENETKKDVESATNELSQMSVISVSSSEGDDLLHEMSMRQTRKQEPHSSNRQQRTVVPKPMVAPLGHLNFISDIEACVDSDLQQMAVLEKLEQRWFEMSCNFEQVLNHLQECSDQVIDASTCCLETLVDSVDITCDKVEGEIKALYNLMAKCDELGTKLSVASTFCDEIKTLKKSVDTLESLYKTRPQISNQVNRLNPN